MQFFLKYCTSLHVNSEGLRERDAAERMKSPKIKSEQLVSCWIHPEKRLFYWDSSNRGGSVEMLPVIIIACI